jgi:ABC-type transporter Mla subunit MlaD
MNNHLLLLAVTALQSITMLHAMTIDYNQIGKALQGAYPLLQQDIANIRTTVSDSLNKLQNSGVTVDQINTIANTFTALTAALNNKNPDINQIKTLTDQARNQLRTIIGKLDVVGNLDNAQRLFNTIRSLLAKLLDAYNATSRVLAILPPNAAAALNNMQGNIESLVSNAAALASALQSDPNFQQVIQALQQPTSAPQAPVPASLAPKTA